MEFDPLHPSSRSTPDSTDFEKVEKEDVMDAPTGFEPDSSTGLEEAFHGSGDVPEMKLGHSAASSGIPSPTEEEPADPFGFLQSIPAPVVDLVYWRCPKKTGLIFGTVFALLISLSMYSVINIVSYVALGVLTVTFSFVTYRKCLAAVQKSGDGNPFQAYLADDVMKTFNGDCQKCLEKTVVQIGVCVGVLRHYFLIADVFDSVKFAVFLWCLTYVGACFNLLTLLILINVSVFTLPKIYEVHREQIDSYVKMVTDQLAAQYPVLRSKFTDTFGGVWEKISVMIPGKLKAQ